METNNIVALLTEQNEILKVQLKEQKEFNKQMYDMLMQIGNALAMQTGMRFDAKQSEQHTEEYVSPFR